MRIELVFTRKDGKQVKIPFSKREIRSIYDLHYIADPKTVKMNRIELNIDKMMFAIHDVMDEGVTYSSNGKNELSLAKGKKKNYRYGWKKEIHYLIKKPEWK